MRTKLTDEQSDIDSEGSATKAGEAKEQSAVEGAESITACEGSASEGRCEVERARERFKPKGTSITLEGCGRRDGSDVNNSMGLLEAYRMILETPHEFQ